MKVLLSWIALAAALNSSVADSADYTAHEWGTFTSVQASDGRQLEWNPLIASDLPEFVYDLSGRSVTNRRGPLRLHSAKTAFRTLQRMETPVIYFRADQPLELDVEVRFPQGIVTEWYPEARPLPRRPDELVRRDRIAWDKVQVLPFNHSVAYPTNSHGSHYFAARMAEANPLQVRRPGSIAEVEKFLFYRGVGSFEAPLKVVTDDEARSLQIRNSGSRPLGAMWVFQLREGKGSVQRLTGLAPGETQEIRLSPERQWKAQPVLQVDVSQGLQEELVRQGLTRSEASAMVSTWADSWFAESGIRVLYLLPQAWVDEILPLQLKPDPRELVRVFVGRAEVISPVVEFALLRQMLRYSDGAQPDREAALDEVRGLEMGRFAEVAVRHVLFSVPPNRQFSNRAWELLEALSQPSNQTVGTLKEESPHLHQERPPLIPVRLFHPSSGPFPAMNRFFPLRVLLALAAITVLAADAPSEGLTSFFPWEALDGIVRSDPALRPPIRWYRSATELHAKYSQDFASRPGFGVSRLPFLPPEDYLTLEGKRYRVRTPDLLGLEGPSIAYVSGQRALSFEDLSKNEARSLLTKRILNEFELQAVPKLRAGKDLVQAPKELLVGAETSTNRVSGIRVVGALRATTQCVACHQVSEGTVLGALSYILVPAEPEEPVVAWSGSVRP